MATQNFARHTAALLLHQNGLHNWSFGFDRAVGRFGQCNYTDRRITVSAKTLPARTNAEVEQTIIHEVAHALTHGHGHDRVWLRQARALGYKGSVSTKVTADVQRAIDQTANYAGECQKCMTVAAYGQRARTRSYTHKNCGGKIVWKRLTRV